MRNVVVVTSDRSVSLQRVANDIKYVFNKNGIHNVKLILSADADPSTYKEVDTAIIVMTFDPAWVLPYMYLARALKNRGKKVFFYTTTEGRIKRIHGDQWIYRDLSFIANSKYTARVDAVVYHGIRVDAFKAFKWRAKAIREKLGLSQNDFVVGYIAGGYMRKGHDVFAEVCKIVKEKDPSIKFVILTDRKGASHYNEVDNVILIPEFGKLSQDMVYGLYHTFDLYAQASLSEGYALPIVEALAAGKPVVHADYNPLSEITTPKTSFRVPVIDVSYKREFGAIEYELHFYDPNDFADAIIQAKDEVLKNRSDYKARCIERAKEFDVEKTYKYFVKSSIIGGEDLALQV